MNTKLLLKTLIIAGFTLGASMANAKKSVPWGNWCFQPAVGSFGEGPFAISFWDELTAKKIVFLKNSATGRNSMPQSCYDATYKAVTEETRLCLKWGGSSEVSIPSGRQITLKNVKQCYTE